MWRPRVGLPVWVGRRSGPLNSYPVAVADQIHVNGLDAERDVANRYSIVGARIQTCCRRRGKSHAPRWRIIAESRRLLSRRLNRSGRNVARPANAVA
jgi:hypothetical protein